MTNPCFLKEIGLVDLIFFLFKTADSLLAPVVKMYIYDKVCEKITGREECDDHDKQQIVVQESAAVYLVVYKLLLHLPSIFWGLLCGAWSDKIGRKTPMILSCLGLLSSASCFALSTISVEVSLPFIVAGAAVCGLLGKSAVISMAVHSYSADTTTEERRTNKLGVLLAMNFYGLFAGSLLAGTLVAMFNYAVLFTVVGVAVSVDMVIIIFALKESVNQESEEDEKSKKQCLQNFSLCRIEHLRESLKVFFTKREKGKHWAICVFFCTLLINQTCKAGENDITLLFVQLGPLSWPNHMYGLLLAFDYACFALILCSVLPLLTDIFHIRDQQLVLIGLISKLCRVLLLVFSNRTWMVFAAVLVGAPTVLLISASKSFLSKNVQEHEVGKLFSLISCAETVASLLGSVMFSSLYGWTVGVFPGTTFAAEAVLYLMTVIVVAWMSANRKGGERERLLSESGKEEILEEKSSKE